MKRATTHTLIALATVAFIALSSPSLRASDDGSRSRARDAQDAPGRYLLDVALSVDGAMGANLALKLLETGRLRSRVLRMEACDLVRARIAEAAEESPVEFVDGQFTENREGQRYIGLSIYPVDALRLRCRLAVQLLDMDARAARNLLLELPPGLNLRKAACSDVLLPKADEFYATLGEILSRGVSAKERRMGLQWEIVRRYVGGVSTPGEIGPASALARSIGAPSNVVELIVSDLAGAIARMEGSPREIYQMASRKGGGEALAALLDSARTSEIASKQLRESMRGLVLRSLAAPRCADLPATGVTAVVAYFNEAVFPDHRIVPEEISASSTGVAPNLERLWVSARSREMLTDFQNLNTARRELAPSADGTDWKRSFMEYASRVRDWTAVQERTDYDFIAQKTTIIGAMIQIAPDDASRLEALRDFAVMLRHARTAGIEPHVLLGHASVVLGQANEAERRLALEMFKASGSEVLSGYAAMQLEGVDVFGIQGAQTSP